MEAPQDKKFMRLALGQAIDSKQRGDVPFGAIIVQDGRAIVTAGNSEHLDQDVTCHAEVKAISQASRLLGRRDLSDCTLYSTSEPCPMCAGAIFNSCISRIVYGMSRDDLPHLFHARAIRFLDLAKDWQYDPEVLGGILKQEVIQVFLDYKQYFGVKPFVERSPKSLV